MKVSKHENISQLMEYIYREMTLSVWQVCLKPSVNRLLNLTPVNSMMTRRLEVRMPREFGLRILNRASKRLLPFILHVDVGRLSSQTRAKCTGEMSWLLDISSWGRGRRGRGSKWAATSRCWPGGSWGRCRPSSRSPATTSHTLTRSRRRRPSRPCSRCPPPRSWRPRPCTSSLCSLGCPAIIILQLHQWHIHTSSGSLNFTTSLHPIIYLMKSKSSEIDKSFSYH